MTERMSARCFALLAGLACLIFGLAGQGSAGAADWKVTLFDAAVVQGERTLLSEIGLPTPQCSAEEWAVLRHARLWPSPTGQGDQVRIGREEMIGWLRTALGSEAELIHVPGTLVVQRGGRIVHQDELVRLVAKSLTPRAAGFGGDLNFRDHRLPAHIFLPESGDRLECVPVSAVSPGANPLRFSVIDQAGAVRRTFSGSVFMDVWVTVPVAGRPLNRRDALRPEDVSFARKNLAFLRSPVWDGLGGPWRITAPTGRGEVLYGNRLEPLPAVSKGDTVDLVFEGDHVRLRVPAKVLADGAVGQVVEVQNLQSNRQVLARVQDPRTVVVR